MFQMDYFIHLYLLHLLINLIYNHLFFFLLSIYLCHFKKYSHADHLRAQLKVNFSRQNLHLFLTGVRGHYHLEDL